MKVKGDLRRRVSEGGPFQWQRRARGTFVECWNPGQSQESRHRQKPMKGGSLASGALHPLTQVSTVDQMVHWSLSLGWQEPQLPVLLQVLHITTQFTTMTI